MMSDYQVTVTSLPIEKCLCMWCVCGVDAFWRCPLGVFFGAELQWQQTMHMQGSPGGPLGIPKSDEIHSLISPACTEPALGSHISWTCTLNGSFLLPLWTQPESSPELTADSLPTFTIAFPNSSHNPQVFVLPQPLWTPSTCLLLQETPGPTDSPSYFVLSLPLLLSANQIPLPGHC